MKLRDYQNEGLKSVAEAYARGVNRCLVCLATGLGKCVSPDTLIWSGGLKKFGDAWNSKHIGTHVGRKKINGWYNDGINPGFRIETTHGFSIDGTNAHRVWIRKNDGFEGWSRIDEIQVGDYLAIVRGKADFGKEKISSNEAYLLGLIVPNGYLIKINKKNNNRLSYQLQIDGHPLVIKKIASTLEKWRKFSRGQKNGKIEIRIENPKHSIAVIYSPKIKEYLEKKYGLILGYNHTRTIPKCILEGTEQTIKSFLRGYFDGDNTSHLIVNYATSSRELADQIIQLLVGLGIYAGITTKTSTGGLLSYIINIYDVKNFAKLVGYKKHGLVRDIFLSKELKKISDLNYDTIPGLGRILRRYTETIPDKYKKSNIINIKNYYNYNKNPSYTALKKWVRINPKGAKKLGLQKILNNNYIWEKIKKKESSLIRRIDCEVDKVHSFIGNGIINHNTVVLACLPLKVKPKPDDSVLILVNRDELVTQTIDKLKKVHPKGKIGVEKAQLRADSDCNFIVASVQTLHAKRLDEFFVRFGEKVGILIIDECHHAAATGYRRVVDVFFSKRPDGLLMGVTATPQRTDGVGLGAVFDEIVFHRDMIWAIENGYLVPVKSYRVNTNTNLDKVENLGDDFSAGDLGRVIDVPDRNNIIVSAYIQHTNGKKAVAFCPTVKHAEHLCEAFNARGISAGWAHGGDSKSHRVEIVEKFKRGEILVLINCSLFIEGFDVPDAEVMIGARPTQSSSMQIQMVGRILRPLESVANKLGLETTIEQRRNLIATSPKPFGIVLDIADQTRKHSLKTLPTLWGMPPGLEMFGQSTTVVAKKFRELVEKNPARAKIVTSLEDIETALEEVDAYAIPKIPPEAIEISSMAWQFSGIDCYRLPIPVFYDARMPDNSKIKNFAKRFRAFILEAKRKGSFPYEKYAQEKMGFDMKTLLSHNEVLEIKPDNNNGFNVFVERDGKPRVLGSVATLHEAFTRAERWLQNNRADLASALTNGASWRSEDILPTQIKTLKNTYNVPMHLIPTTQGDASLLIMKLMDEQRKESMKHNETVNLA